MNEKFSIYFGNAILRGEWTEYGITSWNELLKFVFSKINKEKNKYQGKVFGAL